MKPCYLLLLALLALPGLALAQSAVIDTTGGRYYRPVFTSVTVSSNVTYGSATTYLGATQALQLDVYQPTGDTVTRRPLIVFAHSGGFVGGARTDAYPVAFCTRLARLGYVVASISYRLGYVPSGLAAPADTPRIATAAVRFFRRDAATARLYRIHPGYVFAAGSSAGAFAALEVGYLDKASEVPAYVDLAALGGIEGNSGNPGYSSAVAAVINLCGATQSPGVIEAGNAPLCSVHGTADQVVPYLQGRIGGGLPPKYAFGSARLNPRATALGISSVLRRLNNAPHVPYESNTMYADTVFRTVRDFLRPLLKQSGLPLASRPAAATALQLYPNPALGAVQLVLPPNWAELGELQLLDATGRMVRRLQPRGPAEVLRRDGLPAGVYTVRLGGGAAVQLVLE